MSAEKKDNSAPKSAAEFQTAVNRLIDERSKQQKDATRKEGATELDASADVTDAVPGRGLQAMTFGNMSYLPEPILQTTTFGDTKRVVILSMAVSGWTGTVTLNDTGAPSSHKGADLFSGGFNVMGWPTGY